MASIQFRGITQVMEGYRDTGCEFWAIFEGRYLRFKGDSEDSLKRILSTLEKSYSEATYTLCCYIDLEKKAKLSLSTPCDGSFNFKIYSEDDQRERNPRRMEFDERRVTLTEKISGIESKMDMLLAERLEDEHDEPPQRLGIIGELMESPLGPVISNILQSWLSPGSVPVAMGAIGNIPQPKIAAPLAGSTTTNVDTAEVVRRLIVHYPSFPESLRMLLDLADTDKPMFNMVMTQFEKLK